MSIIKSPYEISIWRDVLKDGVPKEQKVCVIGSDKMTSQSRAFSPNFVRNANGEKKLSFKMYKQYIDTISGEEVHNPFVDNLINETKVKLYYEDKWYDFIIKDINENSATHLCTYQLEDALVRELSKNGFGITLDAKLNNNLGDAKKLANDVLAETDWTADSEVFVEKVDEALVYVKLPAGTAAVHLLDQVKDENGGYSTGVTEEPVNFESDTTVLAFYSSCKNKPYRFQFIYSDKGYDRAADGSYMISRKDTRTIDEKNCQYYIDIGDSYIEPNKIAGTAALELYLPEGWVIGDVGKRWDGDELLESDSTLSSWYRGDRYGYAQQAVYVPLLEKYCQKFTSVIDKEEYLGYTDSKFVSPTLIQNCINNYNFESKAGWIAVQGNDSEKPKVENVYGRFNEEKFATVTDEFYNGSYDPKNKHKAYMKMSFNNTDEFVLNSGIRDNRTMIENMPKGEEWVLDCKIVDNLGRELTKDRNNKDVPIATQFTFSFDEYVYNSSTGLFSPIKDKKIVLKQLSDDPVSLSDNTVRIFFKVDSNQYTKKDFKNSKIYLKIKPPKTGDYYIENIALYKKSLDKDGGIITPDYESKNSVSAEYFIKTGVVENRYHFFKPELVIGDNAVKTAEEVKTTVLTKLDYTQFIPVFNEGAKKIRTVSAKESNYFNILQSIAETFEGWLDLEIKRDEYGGIEEKKVTFKNYLGETNYANFRYGVNLKDIQRTTSSKNIVSKLIVKQNSNELGQDGFCTIQRAAANPTGENYIYDFQYYHNQGLMDAAEYFDTIYYLTGAKGQDAGLWNDKSKVNEGDFNLKGYALRIKKINDAMVPINEELIGLTQSLVDKQAKLEVAKATKEAATSELATIRSDFHALTGVYPEETSPGLIRGISQSTTIDKADNNDWWRLNGSLSLNATNKTISGTIRVNETKNSDRTARFTLKTKVRTRDLPIVEPRYLYGIYQFIEKPTQSPLESSGLTSQTNHSNLKFAWTDPATGDPGTWRDNEISGISYSYEQYSKSFYLYYDDVLAYTNSTYNGLAEKVGWQISPETLHARVLIISEPYEISALDEFYQWFVGNTVKIDDWDWSVVPENTPSDNVDVWIDREYKVEVAVPIYSSKVYFSQPVNTVDINNSTIQKYLNSYTTCLEQEKTSAADIVTLNAEIPVLEEAIKTRENNIIELKEYKRKLNELFFKKYGRFIFEGTWISEEHTDDNKYYADAQSVLYNSCYPQVQYNINVLFLSKLPGYELFKFNLGDKIKVIDEKFFGENKEQEVVITEISEQLDDPTQDTIKVQTFKNQFQDLFQKITATVQQTQYNSGSYEKGEKFLESSLAKKSEFITNAINSAQDYLQYGQTVKQGKDGITITDDSNKQAQLRLVGGAILFSTTDPETQEVAWRTGLTNEGISADLITAGQLDAGLIQIISGDGPTFRWDSYGISAYDAIWSENSGTRTITGVNTRKFVRFDKYGIYGIDSVLDVEGSSWYPRTNQEIDAYATFALTWEGLKVTGDSGIVARIGKNDGSIVKITNGDENLFVVSNDGNLEMAGKITAKSGNIVDFEIGKLDNVPCLYYSAYSEGSLSVLSDSLVLAPKGINWDGSIGGSSEPLKWKVIVGENFGITDTGIIYATGANLSGHIEAETGTLTNLDVNGKIKLIDNGSISLEGGKIFYNASDCQWNDGGFFLYKGRVGSWLIVDGERGYLQSPGYPYNFDGSILNLRTSLTKSELVVDRFASSTSDYVIETYKVTWKEIAEIVSNCSWNSTDGVMVGRADRISCWQDYKGERNYLVAYPSGGIVYLDEAYLGYYDYTTKYEALWADIVPVLASINQNSDARLKKEIEKFDARYNLFYDALQPKRYKYIDGTSDRYHTGFIAQEVVSALEAAGLTTQDFAAVLLNTTSKGVYWQLRRDEFVSLNTWQIQLLKPRVAAIEEKISQLEAELAELKSKI